MKTIGEVVLNSKRNNNQDELVEFLCGLNIDLKNNHQSGRCVTKIDMTSRVEDKSISFIDIVKIGDKSDIKDDLEELAVTSINAFLFLNMTDDNFIPFNKDAIIKNKNFISTVVPKLISDDNYYIDILTGKTFGYYDDYIKVLSSNNDYGISNNIRKTYSTPAGRAFSDKNLDRAFVNIMFYPVVIASVSIFLAVIYVTVSLLIK